MAKVRKTFQKYRQFSTNTKIKTIKYHFRAQAFGLFGLTKLVLIL